MLNLEIPGKEKITIKNIVLDFNGTIALDGVLLPGVQERLNALAADLNIYILTADTFGTANTACAGINGKVVILPGFPVAVEKLKFIKELGQQVTASVGNGANDCLMLKECVLGVCVTGPEGTSAEALSAADVVVQDINHGLELFLSPKRLVATLRG
ncbi:HAD family hydrolase [Pelotomaculum propionicicum]|uniref:ATPase P n=1 Tax=Pelotomaculum propionicicum TaxID=258475 RepID=A0A4Y7RMV3_9FIRM|nr:HAD family hydrolase [Pelotomaculum propionicicum]NLI13689.1 ATPase P [Peptococcaceae bacterium]TEB10002.1 hypothetical protein Pmgp_02697 [Pelotomaculum propionicicum]